MVLDFFMMMYAVLVAFVLSSASRNRREERPNGRAIVMGAQVAFSASATLAVLLAVWVAMYGIGFAPEPSLPA